MLTAVAWNFGSPYFQIRLYITTATDDLHELVYSRHTGGWAPTTNQSVSGTPDEPLPLAQTSAPLSAVSAIRGKCDHETKVYFHPRRIIVAEWDVNAKTPVHAGIAKVSAGAIKKRAIEEETRVKIAEDEERKRREAEELRRKIAAEEEMLRRQPVATAEVQEAINKIGKCSQGYPWKRDVGGWRCEGGGHFVSDEDVRRERYS
jgi:hypothetical protein